MRFPNAQRGVRLLRASLILTLAIAVYSVTDKYFLPQYSGASMPVGLVLLAFAGLLVSIAALVLELVGVCLAAKDEALFRYARAAIILSLSLALVNLFLRKLPVLHSVLDIVYRIPALISTFFILLGYIRLAKRLRDLKTAELGRRILLPVLAAEFLYSLLSVVVRLSPASGDFGLVPLLNAAALALSIVFPAIILIFLTQVKAMLSRRRPAPEHAAAVPDRDGTRE